MDSQNDPKGTTVTSLTQSSVSSQKSDKEKTDIGFFATPDLVITSAPYVIPSTLQELFKQGYQSQLAFQQWQLAKLAEQQQEQYQNKLMEGTSPPDQCSFEREKTQPGAEDSQKPTAVDDDNDDIIFHVKTEPVDPDECDDGDEAKQHNGYHEAKQHERQHEITSNQVKQRLQEFVLNKQQREAAVAGIPDPNMFKRWKHSSGDDVQDGITPLTRSRPSNGDSNFPLRKTASEPNLKAKSKLRAKVSEHRSFMGTVVVPRRRDRNASGSRTPKSATE